MMKNKVSILIVFIIFFLIGGIIMSYFQTISQGTTLILGVDLYPRWIGAINILDGEDPYSLETRREIWQAIYGNPETPTGNPFGFYYPPVVATLFAPLIISGISLEMAAALWCAFLFSLWVTYLFFEINAVTIHRKTDLLLIPLLFLSGLFFRPAFSNYILGQFALLCVFLFLVAWKLTRDENPIIAGILVAFSLIKPSIMLLPVLFLFILNIRNLKLIVSCAITLIVLYLPPTLLIGWWIPPFLNDISRYASENRVSWFLGNVVSLPGIGWLLLVSLLIVVGWRKKDDLLLLASAFALNAIFVPHSADYDLVVFTGLLVWLGYRWIKTGRWQWLRVSGYLLLVWFPWLSLIVFLQSSNPNAVENWYGFIWQSYPNLLLSVGLLTALLYSRFANSSIQMQESHQIVV